MNDERSLRLFAEWVLRAPRVDYAAAGSIPLLLYFFDATPHLTPDARLAFVGGVSTLAGLVMTAATFICALTYQSSNIFMTHVREVYATTLRRNWMSVIGGSFFAGLLPVACLLATGHMWLAPLTCVGSLILVSASFCRAVFWMGYTLFMQSVADLRPTVPVPPVAVRTRRDVTG